MKTAHTIEYYVRRLDPYKFEVSKFAGRAEPVSVYTIKWYPNNKPRCECWCGTVRRAYMECRHIPMIRSFLEAGEPAPFRLIWTEPQ